jgi:hypothetical protein
MRNSNATACAERRSIDAFTSPGMKPKVENRHRGGVDAASRWARRGTPRPGRRLAFGVILTEHAAPAPSMRLRRPRRHLAVDHRAARCAYDVLASGFGPCFNGPFTIMADLADAPVNGSSGGAAADHLAEQITWRDDGTAGFAVLERIRGNARALLRVRLGTSRHHRNRHRSGDARPPASLNVLARGGRPRPLLSALPRASDQQHRVRRRLGVAGG